MAGAPGAAGLAHAPLGAVDAAGCGALGAAGLGQALVGALDVDGAPLGTFGATGLAHAPAVGAADAAACCGVAGFFAFF